MDCPKCGHSQEDTVQCGSCGIYFAKFQQQSARRPAAPVPAASTPGIGLGGLMVAMLLAGSAVYWYMHEHAPATAVASSAASPAAQAGANTDAATGTTGAAAQPAGAHSAIDAVQSARNATVFIRTAWGLGSGFIIDADCHVITNRHVVETDGARVAATVDSKPETQAGLAALRQQLQAGLVSAQQRRRALNGQPGTNLEQMQLDQRIGQIQQALANLPGVVDQYVAAKVDDAARKGFEVMLTHGTHYDGLHAQLSDGQDLALFQLPASHCPFVVPGHSDQLAVGQRLYTVGNPGGLSYTVTTGVFSGLRELNGRTYVQTDAPINPGNSGGPLITEQGQVIGINSMIMRGMQGIGFAIPIEAALAEFPQLRDAGE
jgi:serine protease Do